MASARRILAFDWLTADGYFAGFDGNLNWVVPDDEQARVAAAGTAAADTVLFGRRTYELFERFWRTALPRLHHGAGSSPSRATVSSAPSDRRLDERGGQARFLSNRPPASTATRRSRSAQRASCRPSGRCCRPGDMKGYSSNSAPGVVYPQCWLTPHMNQRPLGYVPFLNRDWSQRVTNNAS